MDEKRGEKGQTLELVEGGMNKFLPPKSIRRGGEENLELDEKKTFGGNSDGRRDAAG